MEVKMQIIFCDVDERTADFLKTVKKIDDVEFITFKKSLNNMTDEELKPYYGAEIISIFPDHRFNIIHIWCCCFAFIFVFEKTY